MSVLSSAQAQQDEFFAARAYRPFIVTIAAPGVITRDAHGLYTNNRVQLATTGALPTGLAADTWYYVIYVDDNTFKLASVRDGTAITTTGSQSGTHYFATDQGQRMKPAVAYNR
jgi:hypothetical protein